jgi:hypothetical protein
VKQYAFPLIMTMLAGLVAAGKFIVQSLGLLPGLVVVAFLTLAILGLGPVMTGKGR